MSYFKAKSTKFNLGCGWARSGSSQSYQTSQLDLRGPTYKGWKGKGRGKGKKQRRGKKRRKGRGKEKGRERFTPPLSKN